jgi:flavin reductase (DIM6/NTAB) family NADH-FMN oxidoreductase RutF
MSSSHDNRLIALDVTHPIWDHFFTPFPLVLIGTQEANGTHNFAPKHMAFPLGWDNYFGFVCTPRHSTYHNIQRTGFFTVSYPRPTQVILTSLAATQRGEDDVKPGLVALPTRPAQHGAGVFFADSYCCLECELMQVTDGFGVNSLITGRIVAAYIDVEAARGMDKDDHTLLYDNPLLVYLSPHRFAEVRETYSFPFPVNYQR